MNKNRQKPTETKQITLFETFKYHKNGYFICSGKSFAPKYLSPLFFFLLNSCRKDKQIKKGVKKNCLENRIEFHFSFNSEKTMNIEGAILDSDSDFQLTRAKKCNRVQVRASACNRVKLRASACKCVLPRASTCKCVQVRASACKCVQMRATTCNRVQLRATACTHV